MPDLRGELVHDVDIRVQAEVPRDVDHEVGHLFAVLRDELLAAVPQRAVLRVGPFLPQQQVSVVVRIETALDLAPLAGVHGLGLVGGVAGGAAGRGGRIVPVHGGDVVAVCPVLGLHLPVAVVGVGGRSAQHLESLRGLVHDRVDYLGGITQVFFEREHVRLQGTKEEAAIGLEAGHFGEVVGARFIEGLRVARVSRILHLQQLAGVLERPAVERAGESGAVVRLAAAQHGTPVRAGVDEAVEFLVLIAGDHHGGAADVGGEVVPHVGDLGFVGEIDPVAFEDVLHLQFEDLFIGENFALGTDDAVLTVVDHGVGKDVADVGQVLGHGVLLHWRVLDGWSGIVAGGGVPAGRCQASLTHRDGSHIRQIPRFDQGFLYVCFLTENRPNRYLLRPYLTPTMRRTSRELRRDRFRSCPQTGSHRVREQFPSPIQRGVWTSP
ncbi:hypothetical protein D9M72_385090 [compost metagenome]